MMHEASPDGAGYAGQQEVHSTASHPSQLQQTSQPYAGSISSQRRRSLPSGPALAESGGGLASEAPQSEDFIHEVLAINTLAMQRTKVESLDEAMDMLNEVYQKLSGPEAESVVEDGQMLDQLRATTLNNMGVTECQRGQPRQALSHFEGCRQLEEKWNIASPSVALNTCAAYNTLRMYDKATAAALETIDMLRTLELQKKRAKKLQQENEAQGRQEDPLQRGPGPSSYRGGDSSSTSRSSAPKRNLALAGTSSSSSPPAAGGKPGRRAAKEEEEMLEAAAHPSIAHSDNAAVWAAAWHNLGVAQINSARAASKDPSEYSNALSIFENALRTTQDKLGRHHPMTQDVTKTFRAVRQSLRKNGAFNRHRTMRNAPMPAVDPRVQQLEEMKVEPKDGESKHRALENAKKDLTITFRGEVTGGQKLTERIDPTPYPGALEEAFQQKKRKAKQQASASGRAKYDKIPFNRTLAAATEIYGNPHPLLRSGIGANDPEWQGGNVPYQPPRVDAGGQLPPPPRGVSGRQPPPMPLSGGESSANSSARGYGSQHQHQHQPRRGGGDPAGFGGGSGGPRDGSADRHRPPHCGGGGAEREAYEETKTRGGYPPQGSGGRGRQQHPGGNAYGSEIPDAKKSFGHGGYQPQPQPQQQQRQPAGNRLPPLTAQQQQQHQQQREAGGMGSRPLAAAAGPGPRRELAGQEGAAGDRHRHHASLSPSGGSRHGVYNHSEGGAGGHRSYSPIQGPPSSGGLYPQPYGGSPLASDHNSYMDSDAVQQQTYTLGSGRPQAQQQQQQQVPQATPQGFASQEQQIGYQPTPHPHHHHQQQMQQDQQSERSPVGPIGYDIGAVPAANPESYEQSKFLLLAQPPVTASMSTNYYQLALDPPPGVPRAGPQRQPVQLIGGYDDMGQPLLPSSPEEARQQQMEQQQQQMQQTGESGSRPMSNSNAVAGGLLSRTSVPTEEVGIQSKVCIMDATTQMNGANSTVEPEGPHELFGAMWVVADNRFIRKGKRHLDRPKYYVNAVLNVEEDGNTSPFIPEPIAEPKTAMMVYSGDSSAENSRLNTPMHQ